MKVQELTQKVARSAVNTLFYPIVSEKRFQLFLQKAGKDPVLKKLLDEIASQKINLASFGLLSEILLRRDSGLTANLYLDEIAISNKVIKGFLNGKSGSREYMIFALAHELGHLSWPPGKNGALIEDRKKGCKIKIDCIYEEALSTKIGLQILEKLECRTLQKETINDLIRNDIEDRKRCLAYLAKNGSNCPRIKELGKVVTINPSGSVTIDATTDALETIDSLVT